MSLPFSCPSFFMKNTSELRKEMIEVFKDLKNRKIEYPKANLNDLAKKLDRTLLSVKCRGNILKLIRLTRVGFFKSDGRIFATGT